MTTFCNGPFWDWNLTWYTTNERSPDFTPCFKATALTCIPSGFLWVFLPIVIFHNRNFACTNARCLPWTWLNLSKCAGILLLTVLDIALLFYNLRYERKSVELSTLYPADYFSHGIRISTYIFALILLLYDKNKGVRTSWHQSCFWLILIICEFFSFRTQILNILQNQADVFEFFIQMLSYALMAGILLMNFWADYPALPAEYSELRENQTKRCPEEDASFFSKITFTWYDSFVWKCHKNPVERSDLFDLNNIDKSSYLVPKFEKQWKKEASRHLRFLDRNISSTSDLEKCNKINTLPMLIRTFGFEFVLASSLRLLSDLLQFCLPELLRLLILFVSSDEEQWKGYFYSVLLFTVSFLQLFFSSHSSIKCTLIGMRIRTVLISSVFKKALILSNSSSTSTTVGEIVNLMSVSFLTQIVATRFSARDIFKVDTQRVQDIINEIPLLWSAPMQIGIAIYLLWQTLGPSSMAGLAFMVLLIPLVSLVGSKMEKLQGLQMGAKDKRIKLLNEILSGIKLLKMYAWELLFKDKVMDIRKEEVIYLRKNAYFYVSLEFMWLIAPVVVGLVTFGTYIFVDENNVLDAQKAFVSLTLFHIIKGPMTCLPFAILGATQAAVSLKRLNQYFSNDEIQDKTIGGNKDQDGVIIIENGEFGWNKASNVLRNINLQIQQTKLYAVVGEVGSGKSSLLGAMLGEITKMSGKVNINTQSFAFVAQQAWIQNATVRENILFGSTFNQGKYDKVLEACALKPDLEVLPAGDQTEIGEKGINLSGGQKQRLSLARAIYNDAEVYLLDDPLSSVDSSVGKHIFKNVIGPTGLLRNKTRVLVTHGITHLPEVDIIIVLADGEIRETGSYQELSAKQGGAFSEFLQRHTTLDQGRQTSKLPVEKGHNFAESGELFRSQRSCSVGLIDNETTRQEVQALIQDENEDKGNIDSKAYLYLAKSVGVKLCCFILVAYAIQEGCSVLSNVWLSKWSTDSSLQNATYLGNNSSQTTYLGVYAAFGLGQAAAFLVSELALADAGLKVSSTLHSKVLKNIVRAPSWFFDITPTGRILNRLGKDVDVCDSALRERATDCLEGLFKVLGTLIVVSYTTPIFITVVIPACLIYIFLQRLYAGTSRQLKRIESVTRSPIYSHFAEVVNGATTIRAFGMQQRFILQSESHVDNNQKAQFLFLIANRWIVTRLGIVGNFLVLFASLFAVSERGNLSSGLVGLSISYVLQITMLFNWLVRASALLETALVSVQRLTEYTTIPQEAAIEIEETKPSLDWPKFGSLKFHRYEARYREGLDLALQDITVDIRPGEKIGIIGRTGAGKSSIGLGLFRLQEPSGGFISIDGVDISTVGLHDLRSRLTVIPQDPILFSGTLRANLDPFSTHDDSTLWRAFQKAHLKPFLTSLNGGLNYVISEGGNNLSVGQRQLVCFARAVLRKSKIIFLDEATAQVDLDTDQLIQQTIRLEFKESTILTVAHRLHSILDSDRVLVLQKGRVYEFDTPERLLNNKHSLFYTMAKNAGIVQ